jgi:hypothetical protein
MAHCDLHDSCFYFNEQATDMPHTTEYLRNLYCMGVSFSECALYRITKVYGQEKVPKDLYPNDMNEILNFSLFDPHGGLDMFLKVIYPDGISGMVKASKLYGLINECKIIAFHCSEGWVEVRRKNRGNYNGPDRRKSRPESFYAGFQL